MEKKSILIITITIVFAIFVAAMCIHLYTTTNSNITPNNQEEANNQSEQEVTNNEGVKLELPTEGNNTILTTESDTTLRVVNEYDKYFFTAKKNLLIMFASWCTNCQEEISEIEKILKHYKNVKDVNVVLIAHEYNDTVTDLMNLVENDVDFGNVEIKVDLKRTIRKTIDPTASTIPISYVIDKNGKVLEKHNKSLTLEKAIDMIGK